MLPKLSRDTLIHAVSVVLRVPSLFIAEAWYRTNPELALKHHYTNALTQGHNLQGTEEVIIKAVYYSMVLLVIALMFLPLKKLVTFYMYVFSGFLLCLSHYISHQFVESERSSEKTLSILEDTPCVQRVGVLLAIQGVLGATVAYVINIQSWKRCILLIYIIPLLGRVVNLPGDQLLQTHNFATVFIILCVVGFLFNHIPLVLDLVKAGIQHASLAIQMYGWLPFLLAMWLKMMLPIQMLVFWLTLFALQLYKYYSVPAHPVVLEGWLVVFLAGVGECCVSPVSLLGLCVTVSYCSYVVLTATQLYLHGTWPQEEIAQRGWTEGFTIFLIAIQTGVIELKSAERAFLMSIVIFIVLSSLIQSIYELTDPFLLRLGASHSTNVLKHVRAIALCTVLWILPLYMTFVICQFFALDFWLLVVVSSCILTSLQVLGSLVVYALFMYDAACEEPWVQLDDVVYYAKATTRVLEFLVALYVVFHGVWESLVGKWTWVNSSILIVHCYFNVWQRLQEGWKSYLRRREAVLKIAALPEASPEQLLIHADVCAICFQELQSARITPCGHYFHALCLRKWLYVQENCPMCHQKLDIASGTSTSQEANQDADTEESDSNQTEDSDGKPEDDTAEDTDMPSTASASHSNSLGAHTEPNCDSGMPTHSSS